MASDDGGGQDDLASLVPLFINCFDRNIIPECGVALIEWAHARDILEQYYTNHELPSMEARQLACYFHKQIKETQKAVKATSSDFHVMEEDVFKNFDLVALKRLCEREFRKRVPYIAWRVAREFVAYCATKHPSADTGSQSDANTTAFQQAAVGTIKVGILWCTFFQRRSFWTRPLQLRDAYRPPSLFASKMRDNGYDVEFLVCDDIMLKSDLDGSTRKLQDDVEILYLMTHGTFGGSGYDAYLHATNWLPGSTGIGQKRLVAAVFDTCELIDSSAVPNWKAVWGGALLGQNLRLLLGFDGPAVIDRGSAERGKAFADNLLSGSTFADSWIQAVHSTTTSQYSKAIAIGIGDSIADAQSVLNTASLTSLPSARASSSVSLEERY